MTLFKTPGAEDEAAKYLEGVTKKYAKDDGQLDVDALTKGKAESDWFIERLQQEAAEMRDELNKRATYDELMAKISATRDNSSLEDEQNDSPTNQSVDIEKVVKEKVSEQLNQYQQQSVHEKNTDKVVQALRDTWGDNYVPKLKEAIKEAELTEEEAMTLAATKPAAFLRMIAPATNERERAPSFAAPASSVRAGMQSNKMNYAYFQKMRKSDPVKYASPEVKNLMWKLAHEQGPDFYK